MGDVGRDDLLKVCGEKEIDAVRWALIKSIMHEDKILKNMGRGSAFRI